MTTIPPTVFLVGAGPGNPGLLTLRAVECLAQADLVLYDRLVSPRLLEHAPRAERVCVSDLPGCHPDRWPHIHRTMIEAARQGKRVVRLQGGDPFLFGRGGEAAEALREAGILFEVVPGVTSGLAAAAYAGIPLTHRQFASAVAFVTGHEQPEKPGSLLDWEALARFPGTLVFYMGIARLSQIASALLDHDKAPDSPTAVIHWGTTGRQRTVTAPLDRLAVAVHEAGITAPALIVIGAVAALRERLAWFEQRPLFNRRVLVTRPRPQAGSMMNRLEELGAVPLLLSTVAIREPSDWAPVDRALEALASFGWLVFTSVNGVHAFLGRLRQTGRDLRALGGLKIAAIGSGTADALRGYHLEPDLVPATFRSEALAEALRERVAGQRVLLARADRGRDVLPRELATVATLEQVAVYAQVDEVDADPAVLEQVQRGEVDYITLTSPNIARVLVETLGPEARERLASGAVKLVTISPVTSAKVRELGLPVAGEAAVHTPAGVVDELVRLAAAGSGQLP